MKQSDVIEQKLLVTPCKTQCSRLHRESIIVKKISERAQSGLILQRFIVKTTVVWLFNNFADSCCVPDLAFLQLYRCLLYWIWLFYNFIDACCTKFGFSTTLHGFSTTLQSLAARHICLFYNFIAACCPGFGLAFPQFC